MKVSELQNKLKEALLLFEERYAAKGGEIGTHGHMTYKQFGAYFSKGSGQESIDNEFFEIKYAGVSVNYSGGIHYSFNERDKDGEVYIIDLDKWISEVLTELHLDREGAEIKTVKDFSLELPEPVVQAQRPNSLVVENQVKAKMLDKLMSKNISFTN